MVQFYFHYTTCLRNWCVYRTCTHTVCSRSSNAPCFRSHLTAQPSMSCSSRPSSRGSECSATSARSGNGKSEISWLKTCWWENTGFKTSSFVPTTMRLDEWNVEGILWCKVNIKTAELHYTPCCVAKWMNMLTMVLIITKKQREYCVKGLSLPHCNSPPLPEGSSLGCSSENTHKSKQVCVPFPPKGSDLNIRTSRRSESVSEISAQYLQSPVILNICFDTSEPALRKPSWVSAETESRWVKADLFF